MTDIDHVRVINDTAQVIRNHLATPSGDKTGTLNCDCGWSDQWYFHPTHLAEALSSAGCLIPWPNRP